LLRSGGGGGGEGGGGGGGDAPRESGGGVVWTCAGLCGALRPWHVSEGACDLRRSALTAVLLCVAASEPSLRYTQGLHALARLLLCVVGEGEAGGGGAGGGCGGGCGAGFHTSAGGAGPPGPLALPPPLLAVARGATDLLRGLLRGGGDSAAAPRLLALFLPDTRALRLRLYQVDRLLLRRLPALHAHLAAAGAAPSSYASPWLLTLFAGFTALDLPSVLRLWDAAVAGGGWAPILSACVAVVEACAPLLEGAPLEQCLPVLRAPRLYYAAARRAAGEEGAGGGGGAGAATAGGGVWGGARAASAAPAPTACANEEEGEERACCAAVAAYALTHPACRVMPAEVEELELNFDSYNHIRDFGAAHATL
jgi:hypothetical protein